MTGADIPWGAPSTPSGLILVVEDDAMVSLIVSEILRDAGFEVLNASHAAQALALIDAHPGIALVFTDIDMPGGMDGLELRAALWSRAPSLPVVLTSGGADRRIVDLRPEDPFVAKPFASEALVATIQDVLKRAATS